MRGLVVVVAMMVEWSSAGAAQGIRVGGGGEKVRAGFAALERGRHSGNVSELRPAQNAFDDAVDDLFSEMADARTSHVRRSVSLGHLDRGQYLLSVSVRDAATGREATREQLLNVTR
jgi:hypothetical protein